MKISVVEAVSYRMPLAVTKILLLPNKEIFPVCPRCNITLEREYQRFCDRCGQHLDWDYFDDAEIVRFTYKSSL